MACWIKIRCRVHLSRARIYRRRGWPLALQVGVTLIGIGKPNVLTGPLGLATDGKVLWRAQYGPFGQVLRIGAFASPSSGNRQFRLRLRLPGQYEDEETGLYYNGQRYYDPQRGRYLTPDPLGTPDGPNGYAYVRGNPLKYVDPDGLILFAFDGTRGMMKAIRLRCRMW
jgi:RHS repeat-associated protein